MKAKSQRNNESVVRIGFDFDKVLVEYPPLIPDNLINWIYKKQSKTLKYRMPGKIEQKIRILSHYPLFRQPILENVDALKSFHERNYPLFLISGRLGFLDKRTERILNKFELKPYFKEIHFNFRNKQAHIFKNEIINKLKISHYIDDDLDLLMYLAKHNPNVSFYWIDAKNRSKRFVPFDNIKKIRTAGEIVEL